MLDTKIPDFTLPATGGRDFNLAAQAGKVVVIYFYPKDSTPGCTTEAQQFRDLHAAFLAAGSQEVTIDVRIGAAVLVVMLAAVETQAKAAADDLAGPRRALPPAR